MNTPCFESARLVLRMADPVEEAAQVVDYHKRNEKRLRPIGPTWHDDYLETAYWQSQLEANIEEFKQDLSLRLFIFEKQAPSPGGAGTVVGQVNFSGIMRRAAQFSYLGYSIDSAQEGKGYMREALAAALDFVFKEVNLHRVMANYVPHNTRSGAVLRSLGFTVEGFARDYLYLNGKWEDHILTSLTNKNWDASRA